MIECCHERQHYAEGRIRRLNAWLRSADWQPGMGLGGDIDASWIKGSDNAGTGGGRRPRMQNQELVARYRTLPPRPCWGSVVGLHHGRPPGRSELPLLDSPLAGLGCWKMNCAGRYARPIFLILPSGIT